MSDRTFQITIRGSDASHPCFPGEKALTALERSNVREVRVGCRQGGCGACRVRVLSGDYETGKMSRAHVTEEEEKAGYVLGCRLYPTSNITLEPAFRRPKRNEETRKTNIKGPV